MKKTLISIVAAAVLVLAALPVLAEDNVAMPTTTAGLSAGAIKETIQQKREALKTKIEAKKEELKNQIQAKQQLLKQRLEKIKDEKKKKIAERVDTQLRKLNENRIEHFSNVLEKLENILIKVNTRAGKAETNGKDVSAVKTAVKAAEDAIAAARSVIEAQAGKVYVVTVNTEATLKNDVGQARQALHDDLVKVRDSVFAAREATQKAIQSLKGVPRVDEPENQ